MAQEVKYLIDYMGNLEENEVASAARVIAYARGRLIANPEEAVSYIYGAGRGKELESMISSMDLSLEVASSIIGSFGERVLLIEDHDFEKRKVSENTMLSELQEEDVFSNIEVSEAQIQAGTTIKDSVLDIHLITGDLFTITDKNTTIIVAKVIDETLSLVQSVYKINKKEA